MASITVTVDGVKYSDEVEPRLLLVHYLRDRLGKTGTPVGCDTSNCGACTVHMNGVSVKSCAVLAVQADGTEITTIQGLSNGEWHPLQQAFKTEHALQCGYCTPAMIMPGVQYPHCRACSVLKACCSGCHSPFDRPWMVVISVPSAWTASTAQLFTDTPFI